MPKKLLFNQKCSALMRVQSLILCYLCGIVISSSSFAGGFDSSGQSFQELFGQGNQISLAYKVVSPKLDLSSSQTHTDTPEEVDVSDMAKRYSEPSAALRMAFNKNTSCLLKWDQPFRFLTEYEDDSLSYVSRSNGERFAPLKSRYDSEAFNFICRFGFDFQYRNRAFKTSTFSWLVGLRYQHIEGEFSSDLSVANLGAMDNYRVTLDGGQEWSPSVGFAYEMPDIAFRLSLLYHAEVEHTLSGLATAPSAAGEIARSARGTTHTPQSLNLRVQTGLAETWLGFVNLRWGDWSKIREIQVDADVLSQTIPLFESDTLNYQIGLAKKLSDRFSVGGYFASLIDLNTTRTPPGADGTDIRNPQGKRYSVALGLRWNLNAQLRLGLGASYFYLQEGKFVDDFYTVKLERSKAYAMSSVIAYRF